MGSGTWPSWQQTPGKCDEYDNNHINPSDIHQIFSECLIVMLFGSKTLNITIKCLLLVLSHELADQCAKLLGFVIAIVPIL